MADVKDFSPLWGEWELKELIGEGAFGSVYRAEKIEYGNRYVSAVKHIRIPAKGMTADELIAEGMIQDESSLRRYYDDLRDQIIKEINFCYTLKGNTNIVAYEDHCILPRKDSYGYDIFIRMEYLVPLTKIMRSRTMTELDVINMGIDICTALNVLYRHRMLHRDIKPANIFVNAMGVYKLGDFGEAKILSGTATGMSVRGTYGYMSPEIFNGSASADITADIYSLGIAMYRILNGHRMPFLTVSDKPVTAQEQSLANARRLKGERLPLPVYSSNSALVNIVMKACEFDKRNRFQTPEEMKQALISLKKMDSGAAEVMLQSSLVAAEPSSIDSSRRSVPIQRSDEAVSSALAQAFLLLAEGQFQKAYQLFDRVIERKPHNAEAYLGRMMAELKIKQKSHLGELEVSFRNTESCRQIMRYGNDALKAEIQGYLDRIDRRVKERQERIAAVKAERARAEQAKREAEAAEKQRAEHAKREAEAAAARKKRLSKRRTIIVVSSVVAAVLVLIMIPISIVLFGKSGSFSENLPLHQAGTDVLVSAGRGVTVGLKPDGTVVAVGHNSYGRCDVREWKDMAAVSAGNGHTVGLKSDRTVVAVGDHSHGRCDVSEWKDIAAVSAGDSHTVGLRFDGTVVAVGDYSYGRCDVSEWKDIAAVSAGVRHTVGLKSDRTVVAVGDHSHGQCDVSEWKDIAAVSAGFYHTVGLKSDGTVVAAGDNEYGQCDVSEWKDIVAVSAGESHTVGLKSDGTVVAAGDNTYGQCDVSEWKDIVAVSAGDDYTVGLKPDGTVVAVGKNNFGQCNISEWKLKTN